MPEGILAPFRKISSAVTVLKLLIVLSLIGPAAVLTFVTLQSRALLLDNATHRATRMAEMLAQHASSAFDAYNLAFSRIEEHLLHSEGLLQQQPLHEYLGEIDREMKSVDGIVLIDANGVPLAHSRYLPVPKVYVGDRDYIRNLQPSAGSEAAKAALVAGRDGLVVGAPVRSRYSGKLVLVVSRARKDLTGTAAGALVVSIAQSYFEDFYRTLALAANDRVALVRADARVLAQTPSVSGRPAGEAEPAAKSDFLTLASADPGLPQRLAGGTVDAVSPVDGVRRISGLSRLDGYPVYVEVGFSVDAVLKPWRRQIAVNLAVAVLASLMLLGLAWLALAKTRAEAAMQGLALAETRRRAEAEAALRQAQKMEALGQLTGGLAHDFNNLLNVVLMNLELAARRVQDSARPETRPTDTAKLEAYVQGAIQGAERGVALTHRLLRFAHRQDSEPTELRVPDLVFGLADLLRQAVGSQVRLTLDCPRTLPPVRADANELETALLNLVVNARDAMKEGGKVHLAAREERAEDGSAPFVVVSVKDTGCGMDAAMLARATEPFFTTKEAGKGSGLGLATVERFAVRAGGRLKLDSRPGAGTNAEIWLPAA